MRAMTAILAALDFSDVTDAVVDAAAEWAREHQAGLYLVHVAEPDPAFVSYEPGPQAVRDAIAAELRAAHRKMEGIVARLKEAGVDAESLLVQGVAARKIVDEAERLDASMIVVGSHGHGKLYDLIVGSVAEGVIRRSSVPVLVVPAPK